MFDIGFAEIIVISAVTLVVIGPKEIPNVVRGVVKGARKMRSYVTEFQSGVSDFVDSTGVNDIKDDLFKDGDNWQNDFAVGGEEKDPYAPTELKETPSQKTKTQKTKTQKTKTQKTKTQKTKAKKSKAKKISAKKSKAKKKSNKGASS